MRGMNFCFKGGRVLVLGCGVSGVASAKLCHRLGARVWVADEASGERVAGQAKALRELGAEFCNALPEDVAFDLCVVSPGFGVRHPWVKCLEARGVKIIAELELGARYWKGKILAITGSKGKSSLVKVCCEGLIAGGFDAVTAGNYGTPLCERVLELEIKNEELRMKDERRTSTEQGGTNKEVSWAVTEVSSFQLEFVDEFRPDVAVLLNLQADHLDRHADEAEYRACKMRMFARMGEGDAALFPEGFVVSEELGVGREEFGIGEGAAWRYEKIGPIRQIRQIGQIHHTNIAGSWFDNPVLGLAAAAGVGALHHCGVKRAAIEKAFREYKPLPHRMETAAEAGGVRWVDDSKATSFSAVVAALEMTAGRVRLIAGGRIKEREVGFVRIVLSNRVEKVYLIGECSEFLSHAWAGAVECEVCGDMARAVRRASDEASPGETVLLSPGCASFDQFAGYHERGEVFARLAREAAERRKSQG